MGEKRLLFNKHRTSPSRIPYLYLAIPIAVKFVSSLHYYFYVEQALNCFVFFLAKAYLHANFDEYLYSVLFIGSS